MWLTVTDCHSVVTDRSSDCGLLFLATVRAGVFGISSGGRGGGGRGGGGEVKFHAGPTGLPLCSTTAPWVPKTANSRRPCPAVREPPHESKQKRSSTSTYVFPAMAYGCQTWPLTKALIKKLETSQRAMERKMLNVKLKDRIRNTIIRQMT